MAAQDAIQSNYSRLTSIGVRGGFLIVIAAALPFTGYTFLGESLLGYFLAISLPVLVIGLATATSTAPTVKERRGSPEAGTLDVGSDDASTAGQGEIPTQLFGRGTGYDWMWASAIIIGTASTLAYYDYSGNSLAFLTALPFIMMLAIDQA